MAGIYKLARTLFFASGAIAMIRLGYLAMRKYRESTYLSFVVRMLFAAALYLAQIIQNFIDARLAES